VERHFDTELAGEALPGTIVQAEGLLSVVPDDGALALTTARAYTSYAFGWVEDAEEEARLDGDASQARAHRVRAIALYERAWVLARRAVRLRAASYDEASEGSIGDYRIWLEQTFTEPSDAPLLFWAGYARGRYINARWPRSRRRDRAYAIAMVARSVELDRAYYGASGLALSAYVATMRPGADLDEASASWERALDVSEHNNLLIQLTMARTYARRRQDREMYIRLLREIIDAEPENPDLRLSNRLARRRAVRDLAHIEQTFPLAD